MNEVTRLRILGLANWCAIAYLAILFLGWALIAGFLPPTSPDDTSQQIAELYTADYGKIRIGMVLVMFAALIFIPFAAVMSHYVARVERGASVLTFTFLLGAAGNMCLTFYPAIWWLVAAFRPERTPEMTRTLNDAAWLQFLGGVTLYLAMPIVITIVAFVDSDRTPSFPRWAGYANIFIAIAILPDQLLFFFQTGVFAWDGLFGVWFPVVWFISFFVINFVALRQTIGRERDEALLATAVPAPA